MVAGVAGTGMVGREPLKQAPKKRPLQNSPLSSCGLRLSLPEAGGGKEWGAYPMFNHSCLGSCCHPLGNQQGESLVGYSGPQMPLQKPFPLFWKCP